MMENHSFPAHVLRNFVTTLSEEIGQGTFAAVLSNEGLPEEWAVPSYYNNLDPERAAQMYPLLQSALRTYYGRGARGALLRIGSRLWNRLLDDSSLGIKAQATLVRSLPQFMRRKPALELLARILGGGISVHTLDLDLLLVDRSSPVTHDPNDVAPVCVVTLGLIRECLFWADGQEHDIEERSCRAMGASQCEFKINIGG
jgi:predicted hydrocarbon binding protein